MTAIYAVDWQEANEVDHVALHLDIPQLTGSIRAWA